MSVFFTADTHFWHTNIVRYCHRPFFTVDGMNETIVANWNSVVRKSDLVYHLGDFAFVKKTEQTEEVLRRLNGQIYLIRGNHDKSAVVKAKGFAWISGEYQGKMLKVDGQRVFLFHTKCCIWDRSHHGAWHLFGHSHHTLPDDPNSLSLDVGVDAWNFTPVSFEQVKQAMSKKTFVPIDHHGEEEAEAVPDGHP